MSEHGNMHQWARHYAGRGFAVFPLVPGTKSPFAGSSGSKDATCDLEQIDAWWAAHPEANIAVKPSASMGGLYVFDVDPRNGGDASFSALERQHGPLSSPLHVKSPGGGFHLYFAAPADTGQGYSGAPATGIDGKYNGYAVLPPSLHPNGKRYEWINGHDATPGPIPTFLVKQATVRERVASGGGSLADVTRITQALAAIRPDCEYHQWVGVIASIKHWEDTTEGADGLGYELCREWSAGDPRHDDGAFADKWESWNSSAPNARTLGSLLHDAGLTAAQQTPDPAIAFAAAGEPVMLLPAMTNQRASPLLLPIDLSDVMRAALEQVRYAVKPWMPRRHVTLLGGHGGIGKSSIALAIGAHVACGQPFAGLEVEQSPVLFVSLEDEASIVRVRLRGIIEAFQLPAESVMAGLRVLDGTQAFAALMTESDGYSAAPIFTPAFHELEVAAKGAGLIVIDNASDAFDANENSRRTVRAFVRGLANIAREHNAAVVLLAHIDKSAAKEGARGNSYSGSTAWHNSARSRLALMEQEGRIMLMQEKANLSAKAEPLAFVFVNGVPMPEREAQSDGQTRENTDQAAMIRVLLAAREAGISVSGSLNAGAHSAMKTLEPLPEYGTSFGGRPGSKRAGQAISALLRAGRIQRVSYRKPNRHAGERFELVEMPQGES
ncbi:bifunctional DNA primase/polymerase [Pseudomonas sp. NBRC 111139]|uniref:Bifunctional DNA primase/polymerase n=1 Tax=Pseudomonas caricapapayae TaxID=46678 RepID=A0ACC7LUG1_9PSED|nr:bifunctional DNA primase/polymerase [Pseudomonas sp. NBRC 111139]